MPRESCLYSPPGSPCVTLRSDLLAKVGLDHCQALILSFLCHRHYAGFKVSGYTKQHLITAIFGFYREALVRRAITRLIATGWLYRVKNTAEVAVEILKQKTPQVCSFGRQTCAWCKGQTTTLEDHHYPVPKVDGGTKTVPICRNCHAEFHYLAGDFIPIYRATPTAQRVFDELGPIPPYQTGEPVNVEA